MVPVWTGMGLILSVMVTILTGMGPVLNLMVSVWTRIGVTLTVMGLNLTLFVPVWTGRAELLTVCNDSCPDWSGMISFLTEMDLALTILDLVLTEIGSSPE